MKEYLKVFEHCNLKFRLLFYATKGYRGAKMPVKTMNTASRRMQAALEDANERSRALCRLLGWAAEEAQLLGHAGEAQELRALNQRLAARVIG